MAAQNRSASPTLTPAAIERLPPGDYHDHGDIIVTPPDRPDSGPRPEHPIARPPASSPRPTPMPSIPSAPRVSSRGGGGRR